MFQDDVRVLTVRVSAKLIQIIDYLVYEFGFYSSRSEFVREAIRQLIQKILENNKKILDDFSERKPIKTALQKILTAP